MFAKQKRFAEDRMDTHKNARLTPKGREEMVRAVVQGGLSKAAAAHRYNTTPKTVAKSVDRFRKEGADGLHDRFSRPHSSPDQTPQPTCDAVEALRRARYTGKQIAHQLARNGTNGGTFPKIGDGGQRRRMDGELAVICNGLDNEDPGVCAAKPAADRAGEADVVARIAIVIRKQLGPVRIQSNAFALDHGRVEVSRASARVPATR